MPILNYSTQIQAEKTFSEIQTKLVRAKAQAVLSEFDSEGVLDAISFRLNGPVGFISFRLPLNIEGVCKKIMVDPKVPNKHKNREQAIRVSLRILKDWIEAQLALVEADLADIHEVFLPYAQNANGETVYDVMKTNNFKQLSIKERF